MLFLINFFFSVLTSFVGIYHHSDDELHVLLQGLQFPDSNKKVAPGLSLHDPTHLSTAFFFRFLRQESVPDSHDGRKLHVVRSFIR